MREDEDKVVGIWIRVSTEDQARGESPEHHERRARAYAEARGWTVAEVFRLDAVSGKSVMGHPEAQRMLGLVRSGALTGLVFSKLARLARNTRELLDFAEIFRQAGADLISLQEAIDTSSPAGRLRPARKTVHLFSGFAFCACGTRMYVRQDSPKYVCEGCRTKIPVDDLEAIYREQLRSILISSEEVEAHRGAIAEAISE